MVGNKRAPPGPRAPTGLPGGACGGGSAAIRAAPKPEEALMTKRPDSRSHTQPRKSKRQPVKRTSAGYAGRGKSVQQTNAPVRAGTKQAKLIDMMRTAAGATITAMGAKMGWQPHSVRAALTGLRKRGFAITREKNDAGTVYRIVPQRKGSSS